MDFCHFRSKDRSSETKITLNKSTTCWLVMLYNLVIQKISDQELHTTMLSINRSIPRTLDLVIKIIYTHPTLFKSFHAITKKNDSQAIGNSLKIEIFKITHYPIQNL